MTWFFLISLDLLFSFFTIKFAKISTFIYVFFVVNILTNKNKLLFEQIYSQEFLDFSNRHSSKDTKNIDNSEKCKLHLKRKAKLFCFFS